MEPKDNSYYRVILRPEQRHPVLDAHHVGDLFFQLHRSNFCGQIKNSTDLPDQVALLYALIQHFGPNQFAGVPAFGDPLEILSFEREFFPELLHSCLSLPYILRFILIHKVPESSLPHWHTLPQVMRSGWEQRRNHNWWPVFLYYQEGLSFNPGPKERDTYGRFLYNGTLYCLVWAEAKTIATSYILNFEN